jgi:hypothetical protein
VTLVANRRSAWGRFEARNTKPSSRIGTRNFNLLSKWSRVESVCVALAQKVPKMGYLAPFELQRAASPNRKRFFAGTHCHPPTSSAINRPRGLQKMNFCNWKAKSDIWHERWRNRLRRAAEVRGSCNKNCTAAKSHLGFIKRERRARVRSKLSARDKTFR